MNRRFILQSPKVLLEYYYLTVSVSPVVWVEKRHYFVTEKFSKNNSIKFLAWFEHPHSQVSIISNGGYHCYAPIIRSNPSHFSSLPFRRIAVFS